MTKKNIYKPMKGSVARIPTEAEKHLALEMQAPHGFGNDVTVTKTEKHFAESSNMVDDVEGVPI